MTHRSSGSRLRGIAVHSTWVREVVFARNRRTKLVVLRLETEYNLGWDKYALYETSCVGCGDEEEEEDEDEDGWR